MGARTQIITVALKHLLDNFVEIGPLRERVKDKPAVDRPAFARISDVLVEHLLTDLAGKNEPVAGLKRIVERCIGVSPHHQ